MYDIDKIKMIRKQNKYSQKDMADLLQTTQQQYSKYEKLQQELPIRHLFTICDHFKVSADWIMGLTDEPNIVKSGRGALPIHGEMVKAVTIEKPLQKGQVKIVEKIDK